MPSLILTELTPYYMKMELYLYYWTTDHGEEDEVHVASQDMKKKEILLSILQRFYWLLQSYKCVSMIWMYLWNIIICGGKSLCAKSKWQKHVGPMLIYRKENVG